MKLFENLMEEEAFRGIVEYIDYLLYDRAEVRDEDVSDLREYIENTVQIDYMSAATLYVDMFLALLDKKIDRLLKPTDLEFDHTETAIVYVSAKRNRVESYKGCFGMGVKIYRHNYSNNRYCYVDYWLFNPGSLGLDF